MRRSSLKWLICSLCALALIIGVANLRRNHGSNHPKTPVNDPDSPVLYHTQAQTPSLPGTLVLPVSNTSRSLAELIRDERAILLENAFWDTRLSIGQIPSELKSETPGAYIVQSKRLVDRGFRELLRSAGAGIVSYIPNNAFLITATAASIETIKRQENVAAVLPYEPLYKMKGDLLAAASTSRASPGPMDIEVLVFPGQSDGFLNFAQSVGATLVTREDSSIGTIFKAECERDAILSLAQSPAVQAIQFSRTRSPAADLSRETSGIAQSATHPANRFGLQGAGVMIGLVDTGVDASHADLTGRVVLDTPQAGLDTAGHGTHVAGVIAGSGTASVQATNVPGSSKPSLPKQFRGVAPAAKIYSISLNGTNSPSNTTLQTALAQTNLLIANNSWVYTDVYAYDFAAASFDAATRDALPGTSGAQPLLFVFPAGNSGQGTDTGTGGMPGTIASPGTSKNVLTIGALEQARNITNTVITCTNTGSGTVCTTNTPWLQQTDSAAQVAAYSGRGNVGIGLEGPSGRVKPDLLAPGTFILSALSSQWDKAAYYGTTAAGNSLSNLNRVIGGPYRFESGTSIAAGQIAGALGLIQGFLTNSLSNPPSPALLKALLINGANPSPGGGLNLRAGTNINGWGALDFASSVKLGLTNTLAVTNSIFVEQDTALATGEEVTFLIRVLDSGSNEPLSATLVWTDPPGNPASAVKLVNDLDLVVTNLDSGEVFFGNAIPDGTAWSSAWDTNLPSPEDWVNNVEKVRLNEPLDENYSVTVRARRVNVDCFSQEFAAASQDFALVISSSSGGSASLALDSRQETTTSLVQAEVLTNSFTSTGLVGTILKNQRFGSHGPGADGALVSLPHSQPSVIPLGQSNQWRFYVITNDTDYTNAAFVLFDAAGLSPSPAPLPAAHADVDLYVSQNPALLYLDPYAFAYAERSIGPGVDELVLKSDALSGAYYIAVKCESHFGAEAGLAVFFSEEPFSSVRADGGLELRGVPSPSLIPSQQDTNAAEGVVFAFPPSDFVVRRVVVSNVLSHAEYGDVKIWLNHRGETALLQSCSNGGAVESQPFIFDDSAEEDWTGSVSSATTNGLSKWNGKSGGGPWLLGFSSAGVEGTNESAAIVVYPQTNDAFAILPGAERWEYFRASPHATNISVTVTLLEGQGPVWVEASPVLSDSIGFNQGLISNVLGPLTVNITPFSQPPAQPGLWRVRFRNQGSEPITAQASFSTIEDSYHDPYTRLYLNEGGTITDAAITTFELPITNAGAIIALEAGLRVEHPRMGDLAFTLISPTGTRLPLQSHRGSTSTNGLGANIIVTNIFPATSSGGPLAASNTLNLRQTTGTVSLTYDFYNIPDWIRVYYETNIVFDSGLVEGFAITNFSYGPGEETEITVVVNEGDNSNPDTAWFYSISSSHPGFAYFTYTDKVEAPQVKFVLPPFNIGPGEAPFEVQPEEPLDRVTGEIAEGVWKLEVSDAFSGPGTQPGELIDMELALLLSRSAPKPLALTNGVPLAFDLAPLQTRWFEISTFPWTSTVTNCLLQSGAALNLLISASPPGENGVPGAITVLSNVLTGCFEINVSSTPPLVPGAKLYVGVQNTNNAFVNAELQIEAAPQVWTLANRVPFARSDVAQGATDYFRFNVADSSERLHFRVTGLNGEAALFVRKGLPLPTAGNAMAVSDNPGTAGEYIVLRSSDSPVLLSGGTWFATVTNSSAGTISYEIEAGQWAQTGLPIMITSSFLTGGQIQITWTSLPGVAYEVVSSTDIEAPIEEWVVVGAAIVADDEETSLLWPVSAASGFFRVREANP